MRQMRKDPSEKCLVEAFYETNGEETEQEMSRRSVLLDISGRITARKVP